MPKLLLADDDPGLLKVVARYLELEGYDVVQVPNGAEALAAAPREQPDLILLDIMMPELDGLEACRQLHDNPATAAIPVIIVSALGEREAESWAAGAAAVMRKPFHLPALLVRIKDVLGA